MLKQGDKVRIFRAPTDDECNQAGFTGCDEVKNWPGGNTEEKREWMEAGFIFTLTHVVDDRWGYVGNVKQGLDWTFLLCCLKKVQKPTILI